MEENLDRENIMKFWKEYIIEDAIIIIEKAMKAIKHETTSSCWRKLCPDVHGFTGFTTEPINEIIKETVVMARKKLGRGERFPDMGLGEVRELIDTMPEELTEDNLMEMSAS